jgi:(1->4)-alpha-D-glucan 1-alpha-D-glucosylmutase
MNVPTATYRVQYSPVFRFEHAREIVSYLADLGISHVYSSPVLKSVSGSTHGYDVVDPTEIDPELGGEEELNKLRDALSRHGLYCLQDIVPNHMAFDSENRMLMEVIENGENSRYARFFDIEWDHQYESLKGRLLTPFLGEFYSEALEDGQIKIQYGVDGVTFNYYDHRLPMRIETYETLFCHDIDKLEAAMGKHDPDLIKYLATMYSLRDLPGGDLHEERRNQVRFVKKMLWDLYNGNSRIREFVDRNLDLFNGSPGDPSSFDRMDRLLSEQYFRLSFWKVATEEINYRRFFTINNLISLRLQDETVFEQTHDLIWKKVDDETFSGLRIDHIDGLYDPTEYLEWVRKRVGDMYILVEKIIQPDESLPSEWPVAGTTGYDFMNHINRVFCDTRNEGEFDRIYREFADFRIPFPRLVVDKKRLIIDKHLAGNIDSLAHLLKRISSRDRHGYDIALYGLKRALVEILAYFPVYRTYINRDHYRDEDHEAIRRAVSLARENNPSLLYELRFLEKFLFLETENLVTGQDQEQPLEFVMRFQQLTGPLMAKGFEDTTLYAYNRLLSLNEVGGSPDRFGIPREEFHDFHARRMEPYPCTLNALSTHDTKRGEDVRARLNVLSEIPGEWEEIVRTWRQLNHRVTISGDRHSPDDNDEYSLYQVLIGSFPFRDVDFPGFVERIKSYVIKAVREAKVHTAWLKPDAEYEGAYVDFVDRILGSEGENPFLESLKAFQGKVAHYGMLNSLGQTLIKITAPGVPDFYQGTELWDLSLVDPDNRRPVDFEKRQAMIREMKERVAKDRTGYLRDILGAMWDGRVKLYLIRRTLRVRAADPELYGEGNYIPVEITGERERHVIAFARRIDNRWSITVVPRFLTSFIAEEELPFGVEKWLDTRIVLPREAPGRWVEQMTGESISGGETLMVGEVLQRFPVALLTASPEGVS